VTARSSSDLPAVGFIGLGRMGTPIAANIAAAGFPLRVWNRSADKAQAFAKRVGCEVSDTPARLATASDIVVTMVADGRALDDVFLADPEVLRALAGSIVVDMSTIGPTYAKAFAERLAASDVGFVEAPVSGSTAAAEAATLALLVGALPEDLERVRPVLEVVGKEIRHLGAPGSASLAKLAINNLIYGINQCVSESLVLGERGGLDREALYDAFLNSAAAAPVLGYRRDAFCHPREGEVTFTLALAEKDLRLTTELAGELGAPMPQAELNQRVTEDAIAAGYGEDDVAIVAEYLRREVAGPTDAPGVRSEDAVG
jgi:3-hydroxyisobutyrate dehydrogenase-like beta-hydroxyacid dehydrogenase